MSLRLAIYQCGGENKSENIERAIEVVVRAKALKADVVVFPELFLTGYSVGGDKLRTGAETIAGPTFKLFSELAKTHEIGILFGYPELPLPETEPQDFKISEQIDPKEKNVEKDEEQTNNNNSDNDNDSISIDNKNKNNNNTETDKKTKLYNSCAFLDKQGRLLLNYRKTHLWGDYEAKHFTPGNVLPPVFHFEGFNIGVLICWDFEFPEPVRILALRKAHLILVPTASIDSFAGNVTIRSRAFENHCYVAYVNRVGLENETDRFCGFSSVANPFGEFEVRCGGTEAELAVVEVVAEKLDEARRQDPCLSSRRPHLYTQITSQ
jgi:predicted amidohydrolase